MGSTIKRPFRTFNGADWDTHYFDTSEDMIKSGWVQSFGASSWYRKLPGGQIRQGGVYTGTVGSVEYIAPEITFPIAFPTKVDSLQLTMKNLTSWRGRIQERDTFSNAKFCVVLNEVKNGDKITIYWTADGH